MIFVGVNKTPHQQSLPLTSIRIFIRAIYELHLPIKEKDVSNRSMRTTRKKRSRAATITLDYAFAIPV